MSTELLLDKTKRLEMYDLIAQIETLNNEVKKLRSRSIDLETDIDSQLDAKMAKYLVNQTSENGYCKTELIITPGT